MCLQEYRIKQNGFPVVISSPSGCGKTTVTRNLVNTMRELKYSISTTTRKKRKDEIHGKDYFFISRIEFEKKAANNEFIEWAEVHGNLYGTSKAVIDEELRKKSIILLDLDVQGGINLKRIFYQSVLIFLIPPSFEVLKQRLQKRGTETSESMQLRLINARSELQFINYYDYIVVNDIFDECINKIKCIIQSESLKISHLEMSGIEIIHKIDQK
jgi:guanylate kinase